MGRYFRKRNKNRFQTRIKKVSFKKTKTLFCFKLINRFIIIFRMESAFPFTTSYKDEKLVYTLKKLQNWLNKIDT